MGLDDLQKSLPVPAILWFCDSLPPQTIFRVTWIPGKQDLGYGWEEWIASASPICLCSRAGGFEDKYELFHPKNLSSLCVSESTFHEGRVGSTGFLVFWESTRQALVPLNHALLGLSNNQAFWELPAPFPRWEDLRDDRRASLSSLLPSEFLPE